MSGTGKSRPRGARQLPRAALGLCLLAAATPALAFRCGTRLVSEGDHYSKVLKICGDPVGVEERVIYREGLTRPRVRYEGPGGLRYQEEVVQYRRSFVEVRVEEWTYNFGPSRLVQRVRFEDGFVAGIDQLGYGWRD